MIYFFNEMIIYYNKIILKAKVNAAYNKNKVIFLFALII